jgi:hypothetical protein
VHGRVEEGVGEEVDGAREDDAGVVAGLEASDLQRVPKITFSFIFNYTMKYFISLEH